MTRRSRSARRLPTPVAVALLAALVTIMLPTLAQAQDVVENVSSDVSSGCLGVRHTPAAAYPDSFSALLVALDLADIASRDILLRSTDGSGTTTEATVPVDENGLMGTELPLVSSGPGTLEGEVDGAPLDLGSLSTYQITDEERPCDVADLPAAAPTPTPTAATEEPTSEPSDMATDPDEEQEEAAEAGNVLAWILLGGGLLSLLLAGWLLWPFGGGGDDGEDDGDDEDPRDAPAPVLYGEEISDPGYDWEVYLVTSGSFTDLATDGNTRVPIRTAEPGSTIVGTYFVAFTTEVVEHQSPWRSSEFQLRMLQGLQGEAEAALTGDPKADLWTDHWLKFEEKLEGVAGDVGDGAYARGKARVRPHGWDSRSPWTQPAQLSPYDKIAKRTGSSPTPARLSTGR